MNENKNCNNRPRVEWKNGKCIIHHPSDKAVINERKVIAQRRPSAVTRINKQNKAAALVHNKSSEKAHYTNDSLLSCFIEELKRRRSVVSAFLIIVLISVIGAILITTLPANISNGNMSAANKNGTDATYGDKHPAAISAQTNYEFAVCIDPGHGFDDPGTSNDELKVYEHEVVLAVGLKLRDKLENAGIKVYMTHDTNEAPLNAKDQYLFGLSKRNGFANSLSDVGFFISIHCDAYLEDTSVRGARVYHMQRDDVAGSIATKIADELKELGSDANIPVKAMKGMNSFVVLRDSDMPAVLVETGFVSNPEEATAMLTDKWQDDMAQALADAIIGAYENGILS